MKKCLLGPMGFVWWCDCGLRISRAAHADKPCNSYSSFPAELLTDVADNGRKCGELCDIRDGAHTLLLSPETSQTG